MISSKSKINSNNDPVYNFFSNQIAEVISKISSNSLQLKRMVKTQTELKRGKAYLVKLRREYVLNKIGCNRPLKTKEKRFINV